MGEGGGGTAVHGCHCPVDMAVRMLKVLAKPNVNVTCSYYVCKCKLNSTGFTFQVHSI